MKIKDVTSQVVYTAKRTSDCNCGACCDPTASSTKFTVRDPNKEPVIIGERFQDSSGCCSVDQVRITFSLFSCFRITFFHLVVILPYYTKIHQDYINTGGISDNGLTPYTNMLSLTASSIPQHIEVTYPSGVFVGQVKRLAERSYELTNTSGDVILTIEGESGCCTRPPFQVYFVQVSFFLLLEL